MQTSTSYKCNKCSDTGIIIIESENSQPSSRECECQAEIRANRTWDNSGFDISQAKQTFSTYKVWNESSRQAKKVATEYYTNFKDIIKERSNSIAFIGQVGCGKTHLSIALAVNFLKKGTPVVYMPYRDVITKLKQNMIDEVYYNKEMNKYKNAKVLLIDDLFKGKINDTDKNIMFEIINYRYLKNMPMIISSEKQAEDILDFDEAIGSRILEMCKSYTVEIQGRENNYRIGDLKCLSVVR